MLKRICTYGLLLALTGGLGYLYFSTLTQRKDVAKHACQGLQPEPQDRVAPPFELPDLAGQKRSLAASRGKIVLVHFWATWCRPCLEELPSLYPLVKNLAGKPFELLAVSVDDSAEVVRSFFRKYNLPDLPIVMDPKKTIASAYGSSKFPESYLVDAQGKIRYRFVNQRNWSGATATTCIQSMLD